MKIAFLGLGAMGTLMARRLVDGGHSVTVWNRTTRALEGASTAASPREAAAGAEVVISMVTDLKASSTVWLDPETGALEGMRRGSTAIECSTLTPAWTRDLAGRFAQTKVGFIEAPVVGTLPQAESGSLRILVGGAPSGAALEALCVLGTPVEIGPIGQAMALKLAVNTLFATQVAALGEVVALMKSEQITEDRALALLENTPVFPPVLSGVAALMRAKDDAPRFPVALVEKDLSYAEATVPLPLIGAVRQRYAAAMEAGLGDRNLTAITQLA